MPRYKHPSLEISDVLVIIFLIKGALILKWSALIESIFIFWTIRTLLFSRQVNLCTALCSLKKKIKLVLVSGAEIVKNRGGEYIPTQKITINNNYSPLSANILVLVNTPS